MAMRCAQHLANAEDIAQHDSAARALGRLARTFPAQIEALNRYRSHGEPAITCRTCRSGMAAKPLSATSRKHASVIVSDKKPGLRGAECAEGLRLQATARFRRGPAGSTGMSDHIRNTGANAREPALWRQNPFGGPCALAGGARQEALPHAWRRAGIRRARGKPERAQSTACSLGMRSPSEADSGGVG